MIASLFVKSNISKKYKRLICKQRLNKNEFLIKKFEIELNAVYILIVYIF